MSLIREIKNCSICEDVLPFAPRPIFQISRKSQILIVGQAPGLKAHESRRPWNDASGVRLRAWLNLEDKIFYNREFVSIVPMGLCYPGRGKSGDNPPRPECSVRWMDSVLSFLKHREITVLVGSYSVRHFLGATAFDATIRELAESDSPFIALPHPSPRNNIWLSKNQWFERECLPLIQEKMKKHSPFSMRKEPQEQI